MSEISREVLLEGLSALTGITLKSRTELQEVSTAVELTVENVLPVVFKMLFKSVVPDLTSLLTQLSVNSEVSTFRREYFVDMDEFFHPKFDCDFRSGASSSKCSRGKESYTRPWGWYRFALKVLDKYPDGNTWLGPDGWRSESAPGEWPVSFHGTSIEGARGITETHYRAGPRDVYGRGIYSTPDISIAEDYAMSKKFTSKNGKTYKVIMQNRINHKKRVITKKKDYWLIPVPEGTSPEKEKEIVETSIRPYGILIKEGSPQQIICLHRKPGSRTARQTLRSSWKLTLSTAGTAQQRQADLELLMVKCRAFYLPREFSSVYILATYILPRANSATALRLLHDAISKQETAHPDAAFSVAGDFNHCNLRTVLSKYHQHVSFPTRESNILDQVYSNVRGAYRSDHISVFLYPAYRQLFKQALPVSKTIKVWNEETDLVLQD
ncbi:uncharacterized protein LOC108438167 [Pygocentrus nattereri]|uniref:uncharacterized protein LOC108438167 n=1 Tax=Pygocentrus nattereri TaxID=42514 RepID=UPI000814355C|nr:uncharacterized protein LOC108438167 [Pygocentrus nattereri]